MRRNFTQLYVHLVWSTWDRLPLITPNIKVQIYNVISYECKQLGCSVVAIGGIEDHVHLLTGFPANVSIAELVKQIKGSSSHCVISRIQPNKFFKWQGSYGAFTVNHQDLSPVAAYIQNQTDHHQNQTLIPSWEIPTTENTTI
jgi:putative transposase